MKTHILIFVMILIAIFSFSLTISSKKNLQKANDLTNESRVLISEKLTIISDLQEAYIKSVFLGKSILNGSLFDTLNRQVQINDLVKEGAKVVIIIAPYECLNCVKVYFNLLHEYFDNSFMIVRLGNLKDSIATYPYSIWHLQEDKFLEKIVELNQPLIALLLKDGSLQYSFVPVNSNLIVCNKYLRRLKEIISNP